MSDQNWVDSSDCATDEMLGGSACRQHENPHQTGQLYWSQRHLSLAVEMAEMGDWRFDLKTGKISWSQHACRVFDCDLNEVAKGIEDLVGLYHADDQNEIRTCWKNALQGHKSFGYIGKMVDASGKVHFIKTDAICQTDVQGKPIAFLGVSRDFTEHQQAIQAVKRASRIDALTGLSNRVSFHERLDYALKNCKRYGGGTALILIDLDYFKSINDLLGHQIGDQFLIKIASRLRSCTRESDVLSRLGSDEFAIIQSPVQRPEVVSVLLERIRETLTRPVEIQGHELHPRFSAGIAMANDNFDSDGLFHNADVALYQAKRDGRGVYRFFDADLDSRIKQRQQTEIDLRVAVKNEQFRIYYQPMLNLQTRQISGLEALIRWQHPNRGVISPDHFIPIAEDTGSILPIGDWVIRKACADAAEWKNEIRLAVNISAVQLKDKGLFESVNKALANSGLSPDRLELEITESALLMFDQEALDALHRIHALGVRFAMDDFGTGYSSLSYLQSFPFDKLKLDRSFVMDAMESQGSKTIVKAIANLGLNLGLATTAEGVETRAQLEMVAAAGYTQAQGYLFSKPAPLAELRDRFCIGRNQLHHDQPAQGPSIVPITTNLPGTPTLNTPENI